MRKGELYRLIGIGLIIAGVSYGLSFTNLNQKQYRGKTKQKQMLTALDANFASLESAAALDALPTGQIWIGGAASNAAAKAVSGHASIDTNGAIVVLGGSNESATVYYGDAKLDGRIADVGQSATVGYMDQVVTFTNGQASVTFPVSYATGVTPVVVPVWTDALPSAVTNGAIWIVAVASNSFTFSTQVAQDEATNISAIVRGLRP